MTSRFSVGAGAMVKVQAIIREERLDAVIARLLLIGVRGLTVFPVKGSSQTTSYRAFSRGGSYPVAFISKILIEWFGSDDDESAVTRAIIQAAFTGKTGDGRVFVSLVEEAVRIRTGERGLDAV
jgi:nitrogen regulatory protein P-II 1